MLTVLQTALEVGLIYGLVALALFISFSILNIQTSRPTAALRSAAPWARCSPSPDIRSLRCLRPWRRACSRASSRPFCRRASASRASSPASSRTPASTRSTSRSWAFRPTCPSRGAIRSFSLFKGLVGGQWSRLVLLALIAAVIVIVLIRFFGTSLGLSIRATGDSLDMVSASSINPKVTITIGLCLANALTALSGCLIGEYNKFCDINLGTGMVTIALASLIIGEVFAGRRGGWASASSASCSAASSTA